MPKFYLRLEGVNIDNFVTDTKDLSTIRGGGLILLNSIKDVQENFPQLQPVSTGASSGLFEFEATDEEAAKDVLKSIRKYLDDDPKYKHATFVLDVLAAGDEKDFVRDKETLIAHNRWRQMRSPTIAIPQHNSNSNVTACAKNLLRPSEHKIKLPENKTEWVSKSVKVRRSYGRKQKQEFYEGQIGSEVGYLFTNEFNELAKDGQTKNVSYKMAVIYIDGNKFGKLQKDKCQNVPLQRQFDEYIREERRELLAKLIEKMKSNLDSWLSDGKLRLETLLWGGDEIIWVVPAWQGWKTIELFYQQAHAKNWNFEGTPLTHSAGIVFCNHKAPIHRVRKLAEELANSVKEKTESNGNYFAYEILESFDHIGRDVEEYRKERVPVSLPSDEGTKALILDGDVVFKNDNGESVIEIVSKLKDKLPRRRLSNIVKELLKAGRQEEVKKQVREFLGEMKDSRGELRKLFVKFGGTSSGNDETDYVEQPMIWMHLNALWDYLAIE
jgi:hypothetical protein